jgi:hypothetical protein
VSGNSGWYSDPWGSFESRYWDGSSWTRHVASRSVVAEDPIPSDLTSLGAGWHPDPLARHELRYWEGSSWTRHVSDSGVVFSDEIDTTIVSVWATPTRERFRKRAGYNLAASIRSGLSNRHRDKTQAKATDPNATAADMPTNRDSELPTTRRPPKREKTERTGESSPSNFLVVDRRGVRSFDFSSVFAAGIDNWEDAEKLGWLLMLALGFRDSLLTPRGADGGVDVSSRRACCQVKHHVASVGRGDIQRLAGASRGRIPVFLAQGYSRHALRWADDERMALFIHDPSAKVSSSNRHALALINTAPSATDIETHTALDIRLIRVRHWIGLLKRGPIRESPGWERRLRKVEESMLQAFAKRGSRRKRRRTIQRLEAAVVDLARALNVVLPE